MKCYRQYYAEIMRDHSTVIEQVEQQFNQSNTTVHKVWCITHRNRKFIIACYYSKKQKYSRIIQLIEGSQYSEGFMYDLANNKCTWYHDHFFSRYAMRFFLQHKPHEEAIIHYFLHNPLMTENRVIKTTKDIRFTVSVVRHGVVYGFYDKKNKIMNYRTIIDFYHLSPIKRKKVKGLRHLLNLQEQEL